MRRIVFITSLSYSGSTLLDLLLGGHPKMVGLGEVVQLLHRDADFVNRMCSCGVRMNDCSFWGPLVLDLKKNPDADRASKYRLVFKHFESTFGPDKIMIDSSKGLEVLELLRGLDGVELKVIFLIKDVRSWVFSRMNHRKLDKRFNRQLRSHYGILYPFVRILTAIPAYYFNQWYRKNREIQEFVSGFDVPAVQVSYERLSGDCRETLEQVCEFLEIDLDKRMLSPEHSNSHIVRGNNMRSNKKKRERVFYDFRWLEDRRWLLPSLLMPRVMKYNRIQVYENRTQRYP